MSQTSIESELYVRLSQAFSPVILEIINESEDHQGHREGGGQDTHFQIIIVTSQFLHKNHLQRHRAVYSVVKDLLVSSIHAFSLKMWTPREYEQISKE